MSSEMLPVVPKPLSDESLSSWVERIAMFYGGDYEAGLAGLYLRAGRPSWQREYDLDTDRQLRAGLCSWTGVADGDVPAILDAASDDTLPRHARVTYCPDCWDDDAKAGRAPYGRRRWMKWSVVHCERHRCWLAARRMPRLKESEYGGWAPLWSSRAQWAKCFEWPLAQSAATLHLGFESASIKLKDTAWPSLNADLVQFERSADCDGNKVGSLAISRAVLDAVRLGYVDSLRYSVGDLIARGSPCTDAVDQLRSDVPVWQGTRVISMLIAVEYLRVTENRPPLNAGVSAMVRACDDLSEAVRSASKANQGVVPTRLTNRETFPQRLTNAETFRQKQG